MSLIKLLFILSAICAMGGCMRTETVMTADIDPLGWTAQDTLRFEVVNSDTLSRRDISILFRFDNNFAERQIPLTVRVTTPDSLWYEEGFTAVLRNRVRANNDFREAVAAYRSDVVLSREGVYVFEVVNAGKEVGGLWGAGIITE